MAIEATRPRQVQMRRLDSLKGLNSELDAGTESLELVIVTIFVGAAVATAVLPAAVVVVVVVGAVVETAVPDRLYAGSIH
jgi:hypothetical protein